MGVGRSGRERKVRDGFNRGTSCLTLVALTQWVGERIPSLRIPSLRIPSSFSTPVRLPPPPSLTMRQGFESSQLVAAAARLSPQHTTPANTAV